MADRSGEPSRDSRLDRASYEIRRKHTIGHNRDKWYKESRFHGTLRTTSQRKTRKKDQQQDAALPLGGCK